jgi:hypothetical protein
MAPPFRGWAWMLRWWLWAWVGRGVVREEVAFPNALQVLDGAQVAALTRLSGPFVCQPIRAFVAHDADVGRDPLDVDIPILECVVV